jgi:hypothetical protein
MSGFWMGWTQKSGKTPACVSSPASLVEVRTFTIVVLARGSTRASSGFEETTMMAAENLRKVDQSGLKTGQALTIILLALAFFLNSWVLVAVVAIAQLLGALDAPFAPIVCSI